MAFDREPRSMTDKGVSSSSRPKAIAIFSKSTCALCSGEAAVVLMADKLGSSCLDVEDAEVFPGS